MRQHIPAGELVCQHCGDPVRDHAASRTGLVHTATGMTRCDGRRMNEAGRSRSTLAVAA